MNICKSSTFFTDLSRVLLFSSIFLFIAPSVNAHNDNCMGRYGMGNMGMDHMGKGYGMGTMGMGHMGMGHMGMGHMGMGHMGMGYGMGPMGMGYMGMLGLTEKQRKTMREINRKNRAKRWALKDKIADYSDQLDSLYNQDKPDAGKIGSVYKKIFDIQRQLIEERIRQRNQQYDVLTKEQREQMKSPHSRMDDDGGMMHRMMR